MLPAAQTFADPYIAGHPKPRVRISVVVMPINGTMIAGQHWPHGKSEQEVYEDHLAEVRENLQSAEDRAAWASANEIHKRALETWLKDNKSKTAENYGGSPSAEFHRLMRRGMPVIASFEILETFAAPPTGAETMSASNKALADAIADGVAKALSARESSSGKAR